MKECKIENLYNLNETIARDVFDGCTYPWEVLPKIKDFIIHLGNTLSKEEYDKINCKSCTNCLYKWSSYYWKKC